MTKLSIFRISPDVVLGMFDFPQERCAVFIHPRNIFLEREGEIADMTILYRNRTLRLDLGLEHQDVIGSGEDMGAWTIVLVGGSTIDVRLAEDGVEYLLTPPGADEARIGLVKWSAFDELTPRPAAAESWEVE